MRLDLGPQAQNLRLYDLWTLNEIPLQSGSFNVRLKPGDGHLYLLGTPDEFGKEKQKLLQKKYEFEKRVLDARLEVAGGCGLVDVSQVNIKWIPEAQTRLWR